jgi:predicted lipid-binding transport protein (Tim44 family)
MHENFQLFFSEGLSTTHGTTHSVGTANTIAPINFSTSGSTFAIQQSKASAAAAPPQLLPVKPVDSAAMLFSLIIGLITGIMLLIIVGGFGGFILFCIALATGFYIYMKLGAPATSEDHAEHRRTYPEAYKELEEWQKTFSCGSCGHRFMPNESYALEVNQTETS